MLIVGVASKCEYFEGVKLFKVTNGRASVLRIRLQPCLLLRVVRCDLLSLADPGFILMKFIANIQTLMHTGIYIYTGDFI